MSGAPRSPADADARETAATDFTRNLCVTAGAGCGKTSLLVERILFAVLARATPLERVVAITFTEKAAAEMRARVQDALHEIAAALADGSALAAAAARLEDESARTVARLAGLRPPVDPAVVRERVARALDADPSISTIHSFALRLLMRHPVEARLPAEVAMDVGDGFRRHAERTLPALVEARLGDAGPEGERLRAVLSRLRLGELSSLARSAAWLGADVPARPDDPLAPLRPRVRALLDELAALRARARPPAKPHRLLEQWDLATAGLRAVAEAAAAAPLPPPLPPGVEAMLDKKLSDARCDALPEKELRRAKELLEEVRSFLKELRFVDESFCGDVVAAARDLGGELATSFARAGSLPSDGALERAAELLAGDPGVRRRECAALDLLLVDEFQDTDPVQCALVLWLCERSDGVPARTLDELALSPGRLFLVGDPKQSIYRFRGADLEAFARARARVLEQGGRELRLTTNFRSRPGVIDAVNRLFRDWIGPESDVEPEYVALDPHRAAGDGGAPAVEIVTALPRGGEGSAGERRVAEGRAVAREIDALRRGGVKCGQIAILLRRLSDLFAYVQPLRELAIPHVVAGGSTFVRRSEVGELASLLLAAADPDDEIASLGALRSTLGAVPDADLHAAALRHETLLWRKLVDSPVAPVARAARELARLSALVRETPAADAVERLVEASLLLPISAAARDGEQRTANLRKLAQQALARAEETRLPFALALRDLLATHEQVDGEAERSLADEEIDAVRILTIHRAKGLEYDVVFVAELARKQHTPDRTEVELRLATTAAGRRAALTLPSLGVANVASIARRERERRHAAAESKRLFYVACTRARERLVLVCSAKPDENGAWLEPLAALGYVDRDALPDESLLPSGVRHRRIVDPKLERADAAATGAGRDELLAAAQRWTEAAAAARAPARRFARPSDAEGAFERALRRDDEEAAGGAADLARAVGIACHVALAASGCATAPSAAQIELAAATAARDTGLAAAEVARAAEALLRSPPVRALQAALAGVTVRAVELPLLLARDGVVWRGSADLVFEDGGELVVGDWKSDRVGDDDASAQELATRYRPQLELYRDALAAALAPGGPGRAAKPPRIELLLLRTGRRLAL
jgi:ATP-dependent helicase/nuclease subunit A